MKTAVDGWATSWLVLNGGELTVSDDELAQKIGELRGDLREFLGEISAQGAEDLKTAFLTVIGNGEEDDEGESAPAEPKSNLSFYIVAALGALAAVAFFLCLKFFF